MPKIKLITDSASDLSYENERRYDILVLPFEVVLGDRSYTSRVDFDNEKFYTMLDEYEEIPLTSQVTAFAFEELYGDLYEQGYTDLIYVSINAEGSATYNNSVMAKESFFEEHPEAADKLRIFCIDGRGYTAGYGYPVVEGAKMAEQGKDAAEIADYITDWVQNCTIYFAPYSLKYAKKSGRIPSAAAFVGELMGLRPIMRIADHKIATFSKVRGDAAIVPAVAEATLKEMAPNSPYCVVYGNDEQVRDDMVALMTEKLGFPPADIYQIGAAIAANAGPRVVGVVFRSAGKPE